MRIKHAGRWLVKLACSYARTGTEVNSTVGIDLGAPMPKAIQEIILPLLKKLRT
jgi:hypothetical protein